jgi:hypothetical protein
MSAGGIQSVALITTTLRTQGRCSVCWDAQNSDIEKAASARRHVAENHQHRSNASPGSRASRLAMDRTVKCSILR